MTLRERVSLLDDYSGELGQALEKLEMERSRGALNRDEQMDFLGDLRRTLVTRDLAPLKKRGSVALLLGIVAGAAAVFLPSNIPNQMEIRYGAGGLAILFLAFSVWTFIRYFRLRQRDNVWLARLEEAAAKGGTIFDVP